MTKELQNLEYVNIFLKQAKRLDVFNQVAARHREGDYDL
eukprot:CAMPEP_0170540206 /NCGR_PEP_ID=MMETSP0211-20121228/247_1 /TAXON_ID=311385 /ORGANISM="Pseudokeronopsis sp., Strain OXSARD2" /LENGTH=38 /DNA_ID= /DNA_START= /DNA_END= /DNA_ORIENTATION=